MIIPFNLPGIPVFSDKELLELCLANPDLLIERDNNGQLFIKMPSVSLLTSTNKSELIGQIGMWNRKANSGKILGSGCGYFLADNSMRVPDIAWIRLDRWNALSMSEKKTFPHLAPDFVIELKSKTDNLKDLQVKMLKWIQNGVRLAWLLSTDEKLTYIYEPEKNPRTCAFDEFIFDKDVLVDFSVILSEILEY